MRRERLRRVAGALVACAYLAGGLGPAGDALAALLKGGPAAGACGCTEGESCCGAACCAPAAVPEAVPTPDCCAASGATALPSCCPDPAPAAAAAVPTTDAPPAGSLVLVPRCTCGHRDHQSACVHLLDTHLPAATRAGVCPPPSARRAVERVAAGAVWRPEPRDRVPKPAGDPA